MFTGIVEETGVVRETAWGHLVIKAQKVLEGTHISDSLAVNGACLTVTSLGDDTFTVDLMPETLRCTNLGELHYGDRVNLERALRLDSRLGGHLVLGHIDSTGEVISVVPEGDSRLMRISAAAELMPYIARKGFIAVDGISLTIADLDDFSFSVSLVSYTLSYTTLNDRKAGDNVNLEVDVIARYVERFKEQRTQGLTLDLLEEYGFMGKE